MQCPAVCHQVSAKAGCPATCKEPCGEAKGTDSSKKCRGCQSQPPTRRQRALSFLRVHARERDRSEGKTGHGTERTKPPGPRTPSVSLGPLVVCVAAVAAVMAAVTAAAVDPHRRLKLVQDVGTHVLRISVRLAG